MRCVCVWLGAVWVETGCVDERIGFGLYQSCANRGSVGRVSVFGLQWCRFEEDRTRVWSGEVGSCYVCVICDSGFFCICQVQVSVYCAWRIPAHLRRTQCSILLLLIDICFLPCICLWHISQIQTCLCLVVGPGFVSTSPAFMRSSASHPAGHQACPQNCKSTPIAGAGGFDTICRAVPNRCHSTTACRLCRLESHHHHVLLLLFKQPFLRTPCCCCCRPTPPSNNGGGVQQPYLRTPAHGIPPSNRHPDPLVD